jgi:ribosomal protein S18 acetylase RimI-like enzyme
MMAVMLRDKKNIQLRPIGLKDTHARHSFWVELSFEQKGMVHTSEEIEIHTHETHDKIQAFLHMHKGLWLVALNDRQEIIGELDILVKNLARIKHVGVLTMGILKAYQGLGLGSALLNEALRWAHVQKLKRIELNVFESNTAALGLYKKHGFIIEGKRKNFLRHSQDIFEDDFLMALLL